MSHDGPVGLYRLFDDADALLYVGIGNRPSRRINSHRSLKRWWHQVARTEIEWHPTRTDAERAEAAAIRNEQPLYNIQIPTEDGAVRGSRRRTGVPEIAVGVANRGPVRLARPDGAQDAQAAMPGAHFRILREGLGLTGDWLAGFLKVTPRTVRNWEEGKFRIPGWVREAMMALGAMATTAVEGYVAQLVNHQRPVMTTYRNDAEFLAACPGTEFTASWHRAVAARVRTRIPSVRVVYVSSQTC